MFSQNVSATTITTPVMFEIYSNTTYITIYNQTAEFFNVSTEGHYLDININSTHLNLTTTTNKTITGISFLNDNLTFTVNGSGILTTSIRMNQSLKPYSVYIDGVYSTTMTSDSFGDLNFNYTIDENIHTLSIIQIDPPVAFLISIKNTTCNNISIYESIVIIIFSLALMIFGLLSIIYSFRSQNYTTIFIGVMTLIIGFTMLILGNYILLYIFNILC